MAFPYTCSGALDQIKYNTSSAFSKADSAGDFATAAWAHHDLHQDHDAIYDLIRACSDLASAIKYISFAYAPFYPYGALHFYLDPSREDSCIVPPELTWKSIIEAWAKDNFEGRFHTIAFIDRMRQLIWDEPFNVIWAARPEQ